MFKLKSLNNGRQIVAKTNESVCIFTFRRLQKILTLFSARKGQTISQTCCKDSRLAIALSLHFFPLFAILNPKSI